MQTSSVDKIDVFYLFLLHYSDIFWCFLCCSTVFLMNPAEVPAEFLSVAEQLSGAEVSQRESSITLIKHSYQAVLGTKYPLQTISSALQVHHNVLRHNEMMFPALMCSKKLDLIQSVCASDWVCVDVWLYHFVGVRKCVIWLVGGGR